MNALTGADAFVENELFATLDPLTRQLPLNDSPGVLITDTVGFISNLPHHLIDAFKSTLEEAVTADLLLLILDCSDENVMEQYKTVCDVLEDIGATHNPRLICLNKIDKLEDNTVLTGLRRSFPDALCISAREEKGFDELKDKIFELLYGETGDYIFPISQTALIQTLYPSVNLYAAKLRNNHYHKEIGNYASKIVKLVCYDNAFHCVCKTAHCIRIVSYSNTGKKEDLFLAGFWHSCFIVISDSQNG